MNESLQIKRRSRTVTAHMARLWMPQSSLQFPDAFFALNLNVIGRQSFLEQWGKLHPTGINKIAVVFSVGAVVMFFLLIDDYWE